MARDACRIQAYEYQGRSMALNTSSLKNSLQTLFSSYPSTEQLACHGFAQAYATYAAVGTFGTATITSTAIIASTLEAALLSAVAQQSATAFAQAISTALTTSWIGIPVTGAPQSGLTIGCPAAPGLVASISAILLSYPSSAAAAAQQIANALATATASVTALLNAPTPPPPVILPIS